MFTVNEDLSIYVTRGDTVYLSVTAANPETGEDHLFKAGDVVRFKVYGKKDAENVVLQKDIPITADTNTVDIVLEDTKIGEVISKPKDYWYEVELNPFTNPTTIIGYDEDGAKVFKLFPEGDDIEDYEPIKPEDIPIVDDELDMTSHRPVENQAIAREIVALQAEFEQTRRVITEQSFNTAESVAVERARIDNLVSGATAGDEEVVDIRVGANGIVYTSAGAAVREQVFSAGKSAEVDIREIQSGLVVEKEYLANPFIEQGNISPADGSVAGGTRAVTDFVEPVDGCNIIVRSLNGANIRGVRYNADGTLNAFLSWGTAHTIPYSGEYKYKFMTEDNVKTHTANNACQVFYESTKRHDIAAMDYSANYSRMSRMCRLVMPASNKWHYENDVASGNVYVKAYPYLLLRGTGKDLTKGWDTIIAEVGEEHIAASPSGVEKCVAIPKGHGLYFDMSTNTFTTGAISFTTDAKYVMVALNWDGRLVNGIVTENIAVYAHDMAVSNASRIEAFADRENIAIEIPKDIEDSISSGVDAVTYNNADAVKFGVITDVHANYNAYKYAAEVAKYGQLGFVIVNGDLNYAGAGDRGENTLTGTRKEMSKTAKALSAVGLYTKVLPARGNHDGVLGSLEYNSESFAAAVIKPFTESTGRGWYYYDDGKNNIRVVVLNSCEDASARRGFYEDEVPWLEAVLDSTPAGYSVVTASHHPLLNDISDNIPNRANEIVSVLESFKSARPNDYICHLYGHTHQDKLENVNGVTYVSTTASDTLSSNFAMDCFCINKANKTVTVVRVGDAGENRSFSY